MVFKRSIYLLSLFTLTLSCFILPAIAQANAVNIAADGDLTLTLTLIQMIGAASGAIAIHWFLGQLKRRLLVGLIIPKEVKLTLKSPNLLSLFDRNADVHTQWTFQGFLFTYFFTRTVSYSSYLNVGKSGLLSDRLSHSCSVALRHYDSCRNADESLALSGIAAGGNQPGVARSHCDADPVWVDYDRHYYPAASLGVGSKRVFINKL
jgi:hypothetical protein